MGPRLGGTPKGGGSKGVPRRRLVLGVLVFWCSSVQVFKVFGVFGVFFLGVFGVLGAASGRRGFTRQPENSKRAHLRVPALQTPPKFNEKDTQGDRKTAKW